MGPSYVMRSFAQPSTLIVQRSPYIIPTSAWDSYSMSYFFIFL